MNLAPTAAAPLPPPDIVGRLLALLQLVRGPELLAVPGGAMAGYALASGGFAEVAPGRLGAALGAVALAEAGRFALTAWREREQDALDRPEQPLPAGHLSPRAALLLTAFALLGALGLALRLEGAAMVAGIALVVGGVVWALVLHRVPCAGPLLEGLLWALALGLGALAAPPRPGSPLFIWMAIGITGCFAAFTGHLERPVTRPVPSRYLALLLLPLPVVLLVSGLPGIFGGGWTCLGVWVIWLLHTYTGLCLTKWLWRLKRHAELAEYRQLLLRNLIIMQSFWVAAAGASCFWVAAVLLLWPLSGYLSRLLE